MNRASLFAVNPASLLAFTRAPTAPATAAPATPVNITETTQSASSTLERSNQPDLLFAPVKNHCSYPASTKTKTNDIKARTSASPSTSHRKTRATEQIHPKATVHPKSIFTTADITDIELICDNKIKARQETNTHSNKDGHRNVSAPSQKTMKSPPQHELGRATASIPMQM